MRIHVGPNREPIELDRPYGRVLNRDVWRMGPGQLNRVHTPALGWRVETIAYNDEGVFGPSDYSPNESSASPFAPGVMVGPRAHCIADRSLGFSSAEHDRDVSPHPECTCGYRVVHYLSDIARHYKRHRDSIVKTMVAPAGYKTADCIMAVQGLGLTSNATANDPASTVRCEWIGLDRYMFVERDAAHVADIFARSTPYVVHVVGSLADLHEESRCYGRCARQLEAQR